MLELFSAITVTELIVIIIMILLAAKELVTVLEFFWKKLRGLFDKEYKTKDEKKEILEKLEKISNDVSEIQKEHKRIADKVDEIQREYQKTFEQQQMALNSLIASDVEDIKSDIVKQYHHFTSKQWIDDFSMDAIERRFARYEEEGGNSYVHTLVEKLRQLPNEQIK